jgi:hypothetical protein
LVLRQEAALERHGRHRDDDAKVIAVRLPQQGVQRLQRGEVLLETRQVHREAVAVRREHARTGRVVEVAARLRVVPAFGHAKCQHEQPALAQ